MNTEKNQQKWVKKCENILRMGGKSDRTIINYKSAWNKLFKYYNDEFVLSKLKEEDLILYFKEEYLDKNMSGSTYNLALCAIRLLYEVCFKKSLNRILLPSTKLRKRYPTIITKEEFLRIFNLEENLTHKFWFIFSSQITSFK